MASSRSPRRLLLATAAKLCSNPKAQSLLRSLAFHVNVLRGMGNGGEVGGESGETRIIRQLKPGSTVFDVGANDGQFALAVLGIATSPTLHSFEPAAAPYANLKSATAGRSSVHNVALSDSEGTATLYSPDNTLLASLTKRRLDHFGIDVNKAQEVRTTTIDSFCAQHDIAHIDLLKIDVEGHEMSVLKGASGILAKRAISTVMFEFGGANIDTRTYFQDFYYFFTKLGAKSFSRLTPTGWEAPVTGYTEDLEHFTTTNYVVRF